MMTKRKKNNAETDERERTKDSETICDKHRRNCKMQNLIRAKQT